MFDVSLEYRNALRIWAVRTQLLARLGFINTDYFYCNSTKTMNEDQDQYAILGFLIIGVVVIGVIIAASMLGSFLFMLLWNLVTPLLSIGQINFLQSLLLWFVFGLLIFRGIRK